MVYIKIRLREHYSNLILSSYVQNCPLRRTFKILKRNFEVVLLMPVLLDERHCIYSKTPYNIEH